MTLLVQDGADLASRGAELLGTTVRKWSPIAGGCLSVIVSIELDNGCKGIGKAAASPAIEAAMLEAIRLAGAPAPAVLAYDDTLLMLERLPNDGHIDAAWQDLGSVLSNLHSIGANVGETGFAYGWHTDYAFGQVAIENEWTDSWVTFWAERRLANQLPCIPRDIGARVEALAADLDRRLPAAPHPVLLHGDLWGGNILAHGGRVTGLIDPACYYGDREVDFAMLRLFNEPDRELHDAYGSLDTGSEARLPIYQLWPALVHLRLFGTAYRPLVERLLNAAGV